MATKAVFAEPGTSASQAAAATFLDTISRLPSVAGEASDDASAYTQSTHEGSSQVAEVTGEENAYRYGNDCHPVDDRTFGILLKSQWFFLKETFSVILLQNCFGNGYWKKFDSTKLRKRYQLGRVFTSNENLNCSCPKMWTTTHCWEERTCGTYVNDFDEWTLIWMIQLLS